MNSEFKGFVPYLFFDDAEVAIDWYTRVFGFEEINRWTDASGKVQNAELRVGESELWLDGSGQRNDQDLRPQWLGIWVDDVDAIYASVQKAGVQCEPPVDREFGVRMLNVADEMGYVWGFIKRT